MSTTPFETLSTPFETLSTPIGYYNPDCVVTVKKTNKKTGVVTRWKVPSGRAHVVLNSQEVPIKTKLIRYKSYEMKYLQPGSTVLTCWGFSCRRQPVCYSHIQKKRGRWVLPRLDLSTIGNICIVTGKRFPSYEMFPSHEVFPSHDSVCFVLFCFPFHRGLLGWILIQLQGLG